MNETYFYDELTDDISEDLYGKPYGQLTVDEKLRVLDVAGDAVDPG